MRVVIIGGSGHIGTYLTPRLVVAGHSVVNVSRGQRTPYQSHPAWKDVQHLTVDRTAAEEAGTFGQQIVKCKPDVVIDITCYTLDSAQHLLTALQGCVSHFLHCGTIWVHGPSIQVPVTEDQPRQPIEDYGRRKAAIESYLLGEAKEHGFPATVIHPGHLVGPGWIPLNPTANFNLRIFSGLARGDEILLPNLGRECVHHVHADDVAASFVNAIDRPSSAIAESFHIVSPQALTLYGYARAVASWFGEEPNLKYLAWEEWKHTVSEKDAQITWSHIVRSPCCSIDKARRLLGYEPQYSSLDAIRESVSALIESKELTV
jgi:nucleoside-diphosphate-sugar epimerase